MNSPARKTPLYEEHIRLGGKMVDFSGWIMPLWYTHGQSFEHHAVRKNCGLFDISHMGEFEIRGPGSLSFLSRMLTNNIHRVTDRQAQYNFILNDQGGVIDDCILYRFDTENWMLVVNAGNIETDFLWLKEHLTENVQIDNISDQTVKIDLQGPAAPKLILKWIEKQDLIGLKFFTFLPEIDIAGIKVLISRTGYTGEIGFEIYSDIDDGRKLWQLLLKEGDGFGLQPCGLGARDTLRTEAGLPLHGHELDATRIGLGHPWEFVINWEHDFVGREALLRKKDHPDSFVLPFIVEGKRKAMPGWEVIFENEVVGSVLSGVISPTLDNKPIGFLKCRVPLTPGTNIYFSQKERGVLLKGSIAENPVVKGTARKVMDNYI